MSGQLILTWYVVEYSRHNSTDIDEEIPSEDEDFSHPMDRTDKDTVIISLSPLQEVLIHLIALETSGNRSQHLGLAIDKLERIIATAEAEEELFHDAG